MIKAIIFDCFGVLTADLWKEFVASLPEEQKSGARDLNHALDSGFITNAEFIEQIHKLTGNTPERVEEIINAEQDKNLILLDYIKELKREYKIGLLSNVSSDWIKTRLLKEKERMLFDDILLSYEVGVIKPNPKIYLASVERLGCQPEECIFIDDGIYNCQGAEAVGMKAVQYQNVPDLKKSLQKLLA